MTINFINSRNFDAFFNAYVEALLWSSTIMIDENEIAECDDFEPSEALLNTAKDECEQFLYIAGEPIEQAVKDYPHYSWEQAGHDFALTRNRHGAGFWDRGIDELGDILTNHAHTMGSVDLYLNADNEINQD